MADTSEPAKRPAERQQPAFTRAYLILYNFVSAILWATVLGRTAAVSYLRNTSFVYLTTGEWAKWTQTLAALEILHSAIGLVRSPILTSTMQVASRFLLVWLVVDPFPWLASSPIYTSMLLAWSITEVIRYSYFALNLSGWTPDMLVWLRYNTFFVLYPMGILSECYLIWCASEPANEINALYGLGFYAILLIYIPGSYVLYTYMMAQRRKVMKSLKAKDAVASR